MRDSNSITLVPTDDHVDTAALVTLRGTANAAGDPLYANGGDAIVKLLPLADLPTTVGRWLLMGRTVTSIITHMALPAIIEEEEEVTGEIVTGCWNCLSLSNVRCCEFGRDQ